MDKNGLFERTVEKCLAPDLKRLERFFQGATSPHKTFC